MSPSYKTPVVDAYTLAKTLAHGASSPRTSAPLPSHRPAPCAAPPASPRVQTVLPTRREITCCHCGCEMRLLGKAPFAVCDKCHQRFDLVDYTISATSAPVLKTGGTVRITADGVIAGGEIRATHILLEGRFEKGRLEAFRRLEILAGARIEEESRLFFRDLVVGPGAEARFQSRVSCRDLFLSGRLEADVSATGRVVLFPGGFLSGRLEGITLQVADGAGLCGPVTIRPPDPGP